ncbi:MAG: hypothetical protein AAFR61_10405 [Bacteroidota bacterium]
MEICVSPILTEADLIQAEKKVETLWEAEEGTREYYELEILTFLMASYERQKHPLLETNPIEMIKYRMEQMGLNNAELARLAFNGHRGRVGEILSGKRKLNLAMVRKLSDVLKIDPKFLITPY